MKKPSLIDQLLFAAVVATQVMAGYPLQALADSGRVVGVGSGPRLQDDNEDEIRRQIREAESDGRRDGENDGRREGDDRGQNEGRNDGFGEGQRVGFDRCEREEKQRAYDDGYRSGVSSGQSDGDSEGRRRGDREGRSNGTRDGEADGIQRARSDAKRDSYAPGRERGQNQADASDAREAGRAAGLRQGDLDAAAEALKTDYPRGRKDHSDARWAEAVERQDQQRLHNSGTETESVRAGLTKFMMQPSAFGVLGRYASPDYRYSNPRRSYSNGRVQSAYNSAYRDGYSSGFSSNYGYQYDSAYRTSYSQGESDGCYDARRRGYSSDRDRGQREGYQAAYDTAYRSAYDYAYRPVYDSNFREATARTYRASYDGFYERYFEEARASAYRERYDALFQSFYAPAHAEKYAQMYPIYAQQQYARGVADETEDFRLRPTRLLEGTAVTETILNGLYEPGEALRLKLRLRNFAAEAVKGSDVRLVLTATDASGAILSEAETTLPADLSARSITEISEALEFRMSEKDADKVANFKLSVTYQGRDVGSAALKVETKFMSRIRFAEDPKLQEGLLSPFFVMVSNQSKVRINEGGTLTVRSDPKILEIQDETMKLAALSVQGTQILQYFATVRSTGATQKIPFGMEVLTAKGRRIGLLDETKAVPILNDYRVQVVSSGAESALRTKGLARLTYRIRNVSSRAFAKGLQMKIRFKTGVEGSHQVIGPNPQYLAPLQKGQQADFVVPVSVLKGGTSGLLELEVFEDGKIVVIHQLKF
jgi:hypothetical protein